MNSSESKPRGPIPDRIRSARKALKAAGKPSSLESVSQQLAALGYSASQPYLSLIESGRKVPSEKLAEGLALVLEEDVDLFRSWARLGGHLNVEEFASAAATMRRMLSGGLSSHPGTVTRPLSDGEILFIPAGAAEESEPMPKPSSAASHSRVPFYSSPGEMWRGVPRQGALAIADRLAPMLRLAEGAFAFPITPSIVRRVRSRGIEPGLIAVSSPRVRPLEMGEVFVVQHEGDVFLSHLWWDGNTLALLPDTLDDDLVRIAVDESAFADSVLGQISLVEPSYVKGLPIAMLG
jgi:hypothetical protein